MFHDDLLNLLKARQPGIWVRTSEEKEAVLAIKNAIDATETYENIYTWSMNEGIKQIVSDGGTMRYEIIDKQPSLMKLNELIQESNDSRFAKSRVWVLKDFHLSLTAPAAIRIIRDLKESPIAKYTPIIIISPSNEIPLELQASFKLIEYEVPSEESIKEMVTLWCEEKRQTLTDEELSLLAKRFYGFTRSEILNMLNLSIVQYGLIDLDIINKKKIENINSSGVLDYKTPTASLDNVGGNDKFKKWIKTVEACMTEDAREYGIPAPKGYLSVGIPGTSKSFTAEALAGKWQVPFIKLNMAKINSRFAGETERNMHKALNLVKSCAPCVLLIDEVEKALGGYKSSNSSDSGAIARAFGLVLEFLNDNDNGVFVVMTSNDVSQLPPELTRAGRLDATWFFGLPTLEERKQIFEIHLNKVNQSLNKEEIDKIALYTEKYTGAEIELIVKSALRKAYMLKVEEGIDDGITYEILKESADDVIPISKSSKEQILALERWANDRALYANDESKTKEKQAKIKPLFKSKPIE